MGPVPLLVGSMVVGILVGRWVDLPWWITSVPGAASLVAGALLTVGRNRGSWWLLLLASLLLGGFLGRRAGSGSPPGTPPLEADLFVLEGQALEDESVREEAGRFVVRVTGARALGTDVAGAGRLLDAIARRDPDRRASVLVSRGRTSVREGERVWLIEPRSLAIRRYLNPGVEGRRGAAMPVLVVDGSSAAIVERGSAGALERLRSRLGSRLRASLTPEVAGIAEAVTTGRSPRASAATLEGFRNSGTAHLLAVSGLHLVVIALGAAGIARRTFARIPRLVERIPAQHIASAISLAVAWAFSAFVTAKPPVLRAAVMVTAVALARTSGRNTHPAASLSLAAGVILVADPSLVLAPSFILSFSAVAFIFLATGRIRAWLSPGALGRFLERRDGPRAVRLARGACRAVVEGMAVSCAATVGTMPAVAAFFGSVPVLSPLANVLAVPLFSFVFLPASLLHAVACMVHPAAGVPTAVLVEIAAAPLLAIVMAFARIPAVAVGGWAGIGATVSVSLGLLLVVAGRARVGAALVAASTLVVLLHRPAATIMRDFALAGRLVIVFLDVGQGDAAYVRTPGGEHLLIDAGPAHPRAERDGPLPSFLRAWGVGRIDAVFVSHPHADHFGGMADLRDAGIRIDEVVVGVPGDDPGGDEGYAQVLRDLAGSGAIVRSGPECGPMGGFGVDMTVVHPCGEARADPLADMNDRSLVMTLRHGCSCVLMTGDVGEAAEALIASRVERCSLLKVPHHGSRMSSGDVLLSIPGLELAVVSAVAGNRYGFPHAEALDRIGTAGMHVHRIDEEGALVAIIDEESTRLEDREGRYLGTMNACDKQ